MRQCRAGIAFTLLPAGCAALYAVPDAATAIVIAKKHCGVEAPMGLPPFSKWDARLEGEIWVVHASNPTSYLGPLSRDADMGVDIPRDGSKPSNCGISLQY